MYHFNYFELVDVCFYGPRYGLHCYIFNECLRRMCILLLGGWGRKVHCIYAHLCLLYYSSLPDFPRFLLLLFSFSLEHFLNHYFRVCLQATDSLSFPSSEIFIFSLFLKDIFPWIEICINISFFQHLKIIVTLLCDLPGFC